MLPGAELRPRVRRRRAGADPNPSGTDRHGGRDGADRERPRHPPCPRIDARHRPVVTVEHPDRARPGGDAARVLPDRRLRRDPPAREVDRHDRVRGRGREPGLGRRAAAQLKDRRGRGREEQDRGGGEQDRPAPAGFALARRTPRRRGRGRRLERRVVLEDRPLEPRQRRPGLEAQLLGQHAPAVPVDLQRLGLAPGAIQRQHQLRAQALAQRLARDGGLELGDQLGMAPARQVGLDAALQRDHPALQDAVDLHARLGRLGQLGQRRSAPHAQPGAELGGGALGVARRQRLASGLQAALEALEVQRPRLDPQPIAPPVGLQRPVAAVRTQRAAQLRDVVLQDLRRPSAADARPTARRSAARSRRPRCDAATDARAPPAGDRRPQRPGGRHRPPPAARESGSPFAPRGDATTRATVRRPARMTTQWAANDRALTADTDAPPRRPHPAVAEARMHMSPKHNATRALAAGLAAAALAAPSALADDPRSPTRDGHRASAATQRHRRRRARPALAPHARHRRQRAAPTPTPRPSSRSPPPTALTGPRPRSAPAPASRSRSSPSPRRRPSAADPARAALTRHHAQTQPKEPRHATPPPPLFRSSAPHSPRRSAGSPPHRPLPLAAGPATETVYIQGHTAEINTAAAVIFDASAGLLDQASPIYIIGFPVAPERPARSRCRPAISPSTTASRPHRSPTTTTCSPARPGSEPRARPVSTRRRCGSSRCATAGPTRTAPRFVPITSADQIPGAEAAGELEVINPGASDPYQLWTTTVLVRPVLPER